jgi:hypothetical protein
MQPEKQTLGRNVGPENSAFFLEPHDRHDIATSLECTLARSHRKHCFYMNQIASASSDAVAYK